MQIFFCKPLSSRQTEDAACSVENLCREKKKKSVEEQSVILMSLTELFNRCVAGIEGGGVFIV